MFRMREWVPRVLYHLQRCLWSSNVCSLFSSLSLSFYLLYISIYNDTSLIRFNAFSVNTGGAHRPPFVKYPRLVCIHIHVYNSTWYKLHVYPLLLYVKNSCMVPYTTSTHNMGFIYVTASLFFFFLYIYIYMHQNFSPHHFT